MSHSFSSPLDPSSVTPDFGIATAITRNGYALVTPERMQRELGLDLAALDELHASWGRLPPDTHLRDGGHYRHRRHSCFVQTLDSGTLQETPHRAHWQPVSYNALHGGMERWFEPIEPGISRAPVWTRLLTSLGTLFAQVRPVRWWHIEAHQFRIDTAAGIGRPTPEGAHRDGVDFVAVILAARHDVRGGETRVFEANGPAGVRFTMERPWTTLLLDDARVIHETTPIQPDGVAGVRDTIVLTYRERGFQSPHEPG